MKTQSLFLLIAMLLMGFPSIAQSPEIDSLKNELVNLPQDTNRLNILMAMSGKLYRINPDTGIVYSQQAIDLATDLNRTEDLGYALKNIGLSHYFKSNFSDVLIYWQQSLDAFKSIDHTLGISNLLNNLGAVYYSKGDNPRALEYYFESLRFAEKIDDQKRIATAYVNIGAVYGEDVDTYDQAKENLEKALAINERTGAKDAIGLTALNIGELLYKQNKPDEALAIFQKALVAFKEIDGNLATTLNYIGAAHEIKKDYATAIGFHQEAIDLAIKKDNSKEG